MALMQTCPRCWGSKHEHGSPNGCILCNATGRCADLQLSPHFRLSEFVQSESAMRMGLPNDPSPAAVLGMTDWCLTIGEPIRAKAGVPLHVNSGCRSRATNAVVGGSPNSDHLYIDGSSAADISPAKGSGMTVLELFNIIRSLGVPYHQLVFEFGGRWAHVGLRGRHGIQNHLTEMVFEPGKYLPFDPTDPRVV